MVEPLSQDEFIAIFESMGEQAVRDALFRDEIFGPRRIYAEKWLARIDADKSADRQAAADVAAAETLAISRAGLRASQNATRAAWLALVIAIISAGWSAFVYFFPR